MSNNLSTDKKITAISMLCEGNSIRAIERMTGVHRDTIMRLGVRVGQGCSAIMDDKMHGLNIPLVQVDELWGFIGAKQKTAKANDMEGAGDIWVWVALDAETKLVPAFLTGKRDKMGDWLEVRHRLKGLENSVLQKWERHHPLRLAAGGEDFGGLLSTYDSLSAAKVCLQILSHNPHEPTFTSTFMASSIGGSVLPDLPGR